MKILRPFYLGAGLFFLLVLTAWCCQTALPPTARAFWNPFEVLEQSRREEQRSLALDVAREELWEHLEFKSALVEDLAAGRRSIWETVRVLREHGKVRPVFLRHLRAMFPGVRDDEAVGRHLFLLAMENLRGQPDQAAVAARLEAQLARGPLP